MAPAPDPPRATACPQPTFTRLVAQRGGTQTRQAGRSAQRMPVAAPHPGRGHRAHLLARAVETQPLSSIEIDDSIEITFDGDKDPAATLMCVRGDDCSGLLEPLSVSLRNQDLVILSATVNPTDGVFRVTNQDGTKIDARAWEDCRVKIQKDLVAARIFSTRPLVYGIQLGGGKPIKPIAPGFQMENVDSLRQTAEEVAQAALTLAKLEKEIVDMISNGGDVSELTIKEADRATAAALLDRPLLQLEAMLAMRRAPEKPTEPEAARGGGADLRFQAGGGTSTGPATGNGYEIILQGFNWDSHHQDWYKILANQATDFAKLGFTAVWLPPPSDSVSPQGYLPRDLYSLNSSYGSEADLRHAISCLHQNGLKVLADVVINHRCASEQGEGGKWNKFGGRLPWDASAICTGNPEWGGRGNPKQGDEYAAAPNIDHSNPQIREDITKWMTFLRQSIGIDGWRFDFVKGYPGTYLRQYIDNTVPELAIGEFWDTCEYTDSVLNYNQDQHRQRTVTWCDSTGGTSAAFDFTTKGILQEAVGRQEYWRLVDPEGRPAGMVGMWPSRAVLFIDNHDTGSSLQHWPFPTNSLPEGYAYILTHPGTPCVFYDHIWQDADGLRKCIEDLLRIRKRNEIHCRSSIKIFQASSDVYSAVIDARIAMKMGPGNWSPNNDNAVANSSGQKEWKMAASGRNFAVWEAQ
ncbi:unnamed protein product [Ostreobium quekettii]|uniref:Alpha-amylase n=1 Tax=Ostreobium quekettii TaxID=121088 RepID=A0A8S1IVF4_9CHLO|nr:unnamed protein product [Ostreobium quekettii]|eukprot:evm.model.scf_129.3 EVM.evm.TU.scf_129.3   scf_129:28268-34350(+)